ncbi:Uncharacterised protein [Mycobacteroides abscessus subsp. abscessus]|uniref:Uncharacterized protein n=1 Tax=Mycobacteroides abscessus TaxID=36809 RepID=A0AB33TG75_9MYCO|nr:hypothetical protein [Mycobacteroides abscessus]MBN7531696.1 hypothetical protein [Mycobacteroides abscessus subsp. abscessus]MDO3085980.1 hypothetical protein [Mycobacteroides abscessus subsp. abscessus]MDO3106002.1 hypothetical protein [Mycobacteroides abscessus subsp. abscessus]PVA86389.1 hypothetical protein DDJ47_20580 [Mycobacteroides abscessus]RIT08679.1 hypothetical protein D2E74_03665 [Mycobacteroides abscessus]
MIVQEREKRFRRGGLVRIAALTADLSGLLTGRVSEVLIDALSAPLSVTLSESGATAVLRVRTRVGDNSTTRIRIGSVLLMKPVSGAIDRGDLSDA